MATSKEICGATCPKEDGNGEYVCQKKPHTIFPSAKHLDDRNGLMGWTQAGAIRITAELAAKEKSLQ
jgi:hypothetical protein